MCHLVALPSFKFFCVMKVYTKPEIEIEELVQNISILEDSPGTWNSGNEEPGGPGDGGDDGPAPGNKSSLWDE